MNENDLNDEQEDVLTEAEELKLLKERAKLMGLAFSNNISIETLKAKIEEKMNGGKTEDDKSADAKAPQANPLAGQSTAPVKTKSLRQHLRDEEMKLIRVRITNMDPKKADLRGEVLCVANEYLGNVKKFIPYGEATDNGYHIEHCLYKTLRDREYLQIREVKGDKSNGNTPRIEKRWVREFAIEVLPPLTAKELEELKIAQLAAGSLEAQK